MIFDVPTATTLGAHVGDVSIISATGDVLGAVTVTVQVVDPPAGVPQDTSTPSRDRIGTDAVGQSLIIDQLVVGLDFGTPDPGGRILAIASSHGAIVRGSVPDALLYQLQFPEVGGLAELEALRQALLAEADVSFASTNYLETSLDAIPNDPRWDSWDEANPAGNNWNMELIKAPSAWDITTGDRSVPLAIIDSDIDPEHEDLAGNLDVYDGVRFPEPGKEGHGTHVAGTACAVGNNGIGISGVAWACSLRGYEFGFNVLVDPNNPPTFADFADPTSVAGRMVRAAMDGARVVNMSWGMSFGECKNQVDPDAQTKVDLTNDVYARVMLFAENIGQDVLWVAAAGNSHCDAAFVSPASLTSRFPRNVITVASVNDEGGLSSFSNFGNAVTVAAPGGEQAFLNAQYVYSTYHNHCNVLWIFDCAPYAAAFRGTSQAAPHVSGLAALVLSAHPNFSAAQVKACIVAGSEQQGLPIEGQSFSLIEAPSAVRCEGTIALPPKVDLLFSLDLTGSMGGEIDQIKVQIDEIMAGLRNAAPDTDFRFGVVSYEDYAGFFNSSSCPDSTYASTYGSSGDEPFRVSQPLTADDAAVSTVINALQLGSGGDGPQSYGRVFWEVGQADTMAQLGVRGDALKLVVNFGDNVPHDPDLNAGIEPPLEPSFPSPFDTGYDPGRNGAIDCGGDDIDFQDDAVAALTSADIHLLHVDSSGDPDLEVYWNLWASQTGGEFAAINPDGSVPGGLDLTQLIIELLQGIA